MATLGRLDKLGPELDFVIAGLARCRAPGTGSDAAIVHELRVRARHWRCPALTALWNELGFDRLRQVFRRTRYRIDVEALVPVMVMNRLCDPDSKLGVLRWLDTVNLAG